MSFLGFPVKVSDQLPEDCLMKMETETELVFAVREEDSTKLYKIDKDRLHEFGHNHHGSSEPSMQGD